MTILAEALERQLTSRLREGLVVWLDREGLYTNFVDELAQRKDKFFCPVAGFRGSYLELLLELDNRQEGLDSEPFLLHVPGHNDTTIRETPLLEAYKWGNRFERALPTLVRDASSGRVSAAKTESFLAAGSTTFEQAEAWLQEQVDQERTGFAAALVHLKPEVQLLAMLNDTNSVKADDLPALLEYVERHTGMSAEFLKFHLAGGKLLSQTLLEAWVGWLLCVEYVTDLQRSPVLAELQAISKVSPQLKKTCASLLEVMRKQVPDRYRQMANLTEALVDEDLKQGKPEELGRIDTFNLEDSRLLEAAVEALEKQNWGQAHAWASARMVSPSIWLESDTLRRQEWRLVEVSAQLGQLIQSFDKPLNGVHGLSEALERYIGSTTHKAIQLVDQAHRHFEQERFRLLVPRLRHFQQLARATAQVRSLYHQWVDRLAGEFMEICSGYGYLPEDSLQQRTLYEDVVHPLAQRANTTVAYFMVDGLRFEMAAELADRLQKPGLQLQLKARFAELPSITRVGMNVLAPVSRQGHLKVNGSFRGFRAGEYVVSSPQQRLRSMAERSLESLPGGRKSPLGLSLSQVCNEQPQALKKKIAKSPLIVVHSREIDTAGESDIGVATYDTWLGQLHSAISLLRNAGVSEFVITSDHGFLILDEARESLSYYSKPDDGRRFLVSDAPSNLAGTGAVALQTLGYDDMPGYLVFPRDASTFSGSGDVSHTFAHGGNSLQERVIPVLRLTYRHRDIDGLGSYLLEARAEPSILGHSRLKVRLKEDAETLLSFEKKVIPLALRVVDPADSDIRVSCKQVNGGDLQHQQVLLSVGSDWAEVLFSLEGGSASRAAVEVYHPEGSQGITAFRLPEYFDVTVRVQAANSSAEKETPNPAPVELESVGASLPPTWAERITDEGHRRILVHLCTYENVDEDQIVTMLDNKPAAARKFSRQYEQYLAFLPFKIGIDTMGPVKRYVKKG